MKRRNFIGSLICGSAAALSNVGLSNEVGQVKPGDVPKRRFGKTGEDLTVIGQAGGRLGLAGDDEAKAVVLRAYELGINYFDCARIYWNGHSEEIYGQVLPPFRKQIFITSKSHLRKGPSAPIRHGTTWAAWCRCCRARTSATPTPTASRSRRNWRTSP